MFVFIFMNYYYLHNCNSHQLFSSCHFEQFHTTAQFNTHSRNKKKIELNVIELHIVTSYNSSNSFKRVLDLYLRYFVTFFHQINLLMIQKKVTQIRNICKKQNKMFETLFYFRVCCMLTTRERTNYRQKVKCVGIYFYT